MRTATASFGTILYPEEVVFAFNPVVIKVATVSDITFVIAGTYSDTRAVYKNKVEIDISKYLQCLVDKDSRHYQNVYISVTDGSSTFTFSVLVVWGALNIGETWNGSRKVTWYKNLPFTFEAYIPSGVTVQTRYDNTSYISRSLGSGIVSIEPGDYFPSATDKAVIRMDGSSGGVFDYTFDMSFGSVEEEALYTLMVDECTDGIYLRWIDRHGWMNYYLFKEGDLSQVDKAMDKIANIYDTAYQYQADVYQGKEVEKSIKIGAPLVDEDTFAMLMTLATSPVVEMYAGNDNWVTVNIAPLTITKGSKPLNDMEFVMYYPQVMTQRL